MTALEPSPNGLSPWEMLQDSLKPFRAGDVEDALAYWADDAVVKLIGAPPGEPDTYLGKQQLRGWFQSLFAQHFEIQEELIQAEGDTLTVRALSWSDTTRRLGIAPLEAMEVYVFEDDKIASLTWTISPASQAKLQAAMS